MQRQEKKFNINQGPKFCTYFMKFKSRAIILYLFDKIYPSSIPDPKFEENGSINAQDGARKRNFKVNQGP